MELRCLVFGAREKVSTVAVRPSDAIWMITEEVRQVSRFLSRAHPRELQFFLAPQCSEESLQALMGGDESAFDTICRTQLRSGDTVDQHFGSGRSELNHVVIRVISCTPDALSPRKRARTSYDRSPRPGTLELSCLIVGRSERLVFPVVVNRTEYLPALQDALKALVYADNLQIRADSLEIYTAQDDTGNWLGGSARDVDNLLEGDQAAVETWLRNQVQASSRIEDVFQSVGEQTIQVLVRPPTRMSLNEEEQDLSKSEGHRQTAARLKDAVEVSELIEVVNRLASRSQRVMPFILLESSSGMGKTQMAFNLMARDEVEVIYILCGTCADEVRWTFFRRSHAFMQCVDKDLPRIGDAGVFYLMDKPRLQLYTYAFILALLQNVPSFTGPRTREEVLDAVAEWNGKRPVFFLDEYPCIEETRRDASIRRIRFVRDVFRSFGLTVIVSATNGAAKDIIHTAAKSGSLDELWCVVFPLLPRFQDPSTEDLPRELQVIINNSRPLFGQLAMEYTGLQSLSDDMELAKYLDAMVEHFAPQWKKYRSTFFRVGQVRLFLSASYVMLKRKVNYIRGHFANLVERLPFELWLLSSGTPVKGATESEPWECYSVFPSVAEDTLLHLCLLGGKGVRPFYNGKQQPISFRQAYQYAEKCSSRVEGANSDQTSNDGMTMEALSAGAVVVASRCNGFKGVTFQVFFSVLLYELGSLRSRDTSLTFPKVLAGLVDYLRIPCLVPPNVSLPNFLRDMRLALGTIRRTRNKDMIDILFLNDTVSIECKDYQTRRLSSDVVEKIIKRVPIESVVHLIITNTLQDRYFTEKKAVSFDDFVKSLPPVKNMGHARFYRVNVRTDSRGMDEARLETISGMDNMCRRCQNPGSCEKVGKLIIFVGLDTMNQTRT